MKNKKNRREVLRELLHRGNLLACCPINVTEVYAGMRPAEEAYTQAFLVTLQYYPVTWPVARLAGLLKRDHAKKGITLATTDATIAAVALHNELSLITDNLKHYPMPELLIHPLPK